MTLDLEFWMPIVSTGGRFTTRDLLEASLDVEHQTRRSSMTDACRHLGTVRDVEPSSDGCKDCLRLGGSGWWCYADELAFGLPGAAPAPSHP